MPERFGWRGRRDVIVQFARTRRLGVAESRDGSLLAVYRYERRSRCGMGLELVKDTPTTNTVCMNVPTVESLIILPGFQEARAQRLDMAAQGI